MTLKPPPSPRCATLSPPPAHTHTSTQTPTYTHTFLWDPTTSNIKLAFSHAELFYIIETTTPAINQRISDTASLSDNGRRPFAMGFPGFSNVSAGLFTILMINAALSMAAVKNALRSVLQIFGISRDSGTEETDSAWMLLAPEESTVSSGLVLPSLWEEIRSSLPVASYDPSISGGDETLENAVQCAVCLLDFAEGDGIHLLPRCNHVFHQGCIDKWLDHQQTTCPLCRSSLVSEDLAWRYRKREQEVVEELILWFSSFHSSTLNGLWWQT